MTFHGYIIMLQIRGYKCRICEMFPPQRTTEGYFRAKFASELDRSLADHPKYYLNKH